MVKYIFQRICNCKQLHGTMSICPILDKCAYGTNPKTTFYMAWVENRRRKIL